MLNVMPDATSTTADRSAIEVFSIGHSTRSLEDFIALLREFGIETLADVRSFPGSRRFPHFGRDHLETELPRQGVRYVWLKSLGGRKAGGDEPSPNEGLRNRSFRNYADYMSTPAFTAGMEELLDMAAAERTAMMCAEAVYWRCHRRLISDWLLAREITVEHIMDCGQSKPHRLTETGRIENGDVTYPPPLFGG